MGVPSPSEILISVRPYRLIYEQMIRWFQYGVYDFRYEDFLLPMLQSNKLYELYVLLKIYNYIINKGYHLQKSDLYRYKASEEYYPNSAAFSNMKSDNVFLFKFVRGNVANILFLMRSFQIVEV